jgi:hypothetical protein
VRTGQREIALANRKSRALLAYFCSRRRPRIVDGRVCGRAFGWLTFAMHLGQFLSIFAYSALVGAIGSRGAFLLVAVVAAAVGACSFVGAPARERQAMQPD